MVTERGALVLLSNDVTKETKQSIVLTCINLDNEINDWINIS